MSDETQRQHQWKNISSKRQIVYQCELCGIYTFDPPAKPWAGPTDKDVVVLARYWKAKLKDKKTEALKLALEALEELTELMDAVREGNYKPDTFTNQPATIAITSIREAQAEQSAQQQEPMLQKQLSDALQSLAFYKRRVEALQQWQSKMRDPERIIVCDIIANGYALEPAGDRYKQPAQQQEPEGVVIESYEDRIIHWRDGFVPSVGTKLYTSPPASKPWVGLSLDDREKLRDKYEDWNYPSVLLSEVENILREKNT